jgi:hypothetical protein
MLATTLGIEFNPELDWDEREHLFKISGKIVRTSNMTQSAVGNKDGLWTTVFAAAVFTNDDSLAVEAGKPQEDAGWGNEDSRQDETSGQTAQLDEPAAHHPPQAAKPQQAHLVHVAHGSHLDATHDQREVTKALHRHYEKRPSLHLEKRTPQRQPKTASSK